MALTSAGATWIAQAVKGTSQTAFNGANAYIGLGTGSTAFDVGQTALITPATPRKLVTSGYPTGSGSQLVYQATFDPADANGVIAEIGLFNASSGGTMIGRKVEALGEKLNTQSWTVQLTVTFSAS